MKKFLVMYLCPVATLDDWAKKSEEERKPMENDMMQKWQEWAAAQGEALLETNGAGKTSRVTTEGVAPHRNELMMYSIVQAESQEAAEKMFIGHPHLAIPTASIEIMPVKPIGA